jgi:dihydrofolate reductase
MTVSLLVAASANDVIGRDGALPWHLPADMRRFRALTAGHVVVMGRLTHESIIRRLGHPLGGRTSIVVSRTLPGTATGTAAARSTTGTEPVPAGDGRVLVAGSVGSALVTAAKLTAAAGKDEFFVLGGGSVYQQALPSVERIYLTRVHDQVAGDCSMPAGWLDGFELAAREDAADPASGTRYSFLDYRRAVP